MKEKDKDKENLDAEEQDSQNDDLKKESERLEIDPEVLEKIVTELEEKYNLKKENIKILKIKHESKNKRLVRKILRGFLFWIFDLMLIISLNGYLKFSEPNIFKLIIFSIVFYIIELLMRLILTKYYQRIILYSFGTVMIPITIIALILAQLAVSFKDINNNIIVFYILFLVVRVALRFFLMRKDILTMMKGRKK